MNGEARGDADRVAKGSAGMPDGPSYPSSERPLVYCLDIPNAPLARIKRCLHQGRWRLENSDSM